MYPQENWAVYWTDGSALHWVDAPSLEHARNLERQVSGG
jgi:hypothetical protein